MPQPVRPPAPTPLPVDERLRWVEHVSRLMDSQFRLPGTRFRFGLDPVLGLVPIVGDLSTTLVSVALLVTMLRHGASGAVAVRMALNILIDSIVGAVPILGNIFDFTFKSNERNVALLRRHYAEGRYQGSGRGLVAVIVLVLLGALGLVVWGSVALLHWAWVHFGAHPMPSAA